MIDYKEKYDKLVRASGSTNYICDSCGEPRTGKKCSTCRIIYLETLLKNVLTKLEKGLQ